MLRATLSRLRRRQRRVTLVETGVAAAIVVGATAVPLSIWVAPRLAIQLIALAACVAAIAVVIVAGVRTLPLRRIAALADARLQLEDRLVTALQYADDLDPVSRLIVRDAASRADRESPARVFPHRAPRWIGWIAAGAITTSAVLTLAVRRTSFGDVHRSDASSNSGVTGGAAGTNGGDPATTAAADNPTRRQEPVQHPGALSANVTSDARDAGSKSDAPSAHPVAPPVPGPPREDGRAPAAEALRTTVTPGADAVSPRLAAGTSASRDLGSAGGEAGRGPSAATGAGGVSSRGKATGSGGSPRASTAARGAPRHDLDDRAYAAARARAEAALAAERIPPGLRAYLTTYFNAISPR
jgi:hypothetical protein